MSAPTPSSTRSPRDGGRGDRPRRRVVRTHPHGPGARVAADPALRLRRAEAAVPAEGRHGRERRGVRVVGARGRLGSRVDEDPRRPRRRRAGHQRIEELDPEHLGGGLLRRLREDRPRLRPHHGVRRGAGPRGPLARAARAQDGDPQLADGLPGLRRRAGAARERRGCGRLRHVGRPRHARAHAPRRRRTGRRDRPGRDRLRHGVREGADRVRPPDRRVPGTPVAVGGREPPGPRGAGSRRAAGPARGGSAIRTCPPHGSRTLDR